MSDNERIARIHSARTNAELEQALEGYLWRVFVTHLVLRLNRTFIAAMKTSQYYNALTAVRNAARGRGDRYQDVIQVVQPAADKQLALAAVVARSESVSPGSPD